MGDKFTYRAVCDNKQGIESSINQLFSARQVLTCNENAKVDKEMVQVEAIMAGRPAQTPFATWQVAPAAQ